MGKNPQQRGSKTNLQPNEVKLSGQESPNTYPQTGGGTPNPQIQGVNHIDPKGNFYMGCGRSADKSGNTAT